MKTLLLILSFFFVSIDTSAQSEILTNQSVLDMIDLGFSQQIIVAKIETSDSDFDTTIKALKNLKEMGVSDAIIMAIINKTKSDTENIVCPESKYFSSKQELIDSLQDEIIE